MPGNNKILIIDDETDLCLLLKDYFTRKNFDVSVSHTLTEGTELLYELKPEVLFLDNNLPDGIGWNKAHQFALDNPDLYIVLISAFHPNPPEMPSGTRYKVIEKPISLQDLNRQFSAFMGQL